MRIVIKNPAPQGDGGANWGDYFFGNSLAKALESEGQGVQVVQEYWPNWTQPSLDKSEDDIILVLRGKHTYFPSPGSKSILWVISHPSTLTTEELSTYSLILVGSKFLRQSLTKVTSQPVEYLAQCTDPELFHGSSLSLEEDVQSRSGIWYIANTRGYYRDMARGANQTKTPIKIIGKGWQAFGLNSQVVDQSIDNSHLPELYRTARFGLNDHWADMKHFQIINNRIFDALSCGLPLVTDSFPEMKELFGNTLLYADSPQEFAHALNKNPSEYRDFLAQVREEQKNIVNNHSFRARAKEILAHIESLKPSGSKATSGVHFHTESQLGQPNGPNPIQYFLETMVRPLKKQKVIRILHLYPKNQASIRTKGQTINYLTAGLGVGPWQVELDAQLSVFKDLPCTLLYLDSVPEEVLNQELDFSSIPWHMVTYFGVSTSTIFDKVHREKPWYVSFIPVVTVSDFGFYKITNLLGWVKIIHKVRTRLRNILG